jgi:predicted unusual protein kinase regulating ubiquinone biosynthesis (AarF/ABC1/UbiB family)
VRFPEPDCALTSSDLLVESFEPGVKITDFIRHSDPRIKTQLAHIGLDMYLKMMLEDHFVHADLHPGNLLVIAEPGASSADQRNSSSSPSLVLVVLDVGLVTQLAPSDAEHFVALVGLRSLSLVSPDFPSFTLSSAPCRMLSLFLCFSLSSNRSSTAMASSAAI